MTLLHDSPELKVVLVGLESGQALPVHVGPSASFHFLEGHGTMFVGTEEIEVATGTIVVVPTGDARGVQASSRLVFMGSLGDPTSEDGPH
ncbi:MAG: hypothetical protein ABI251_11020 [Mycobacteriaceae bacterium]